ncbi:RNA-binding component of cleavage and polyadenylation factor [Saxophila tyrrhenica]|uniref:mRNA 3'-end-processing protein n=1 Tax=Saxophila tyrrhenica TaxID=1690608 RepID=A0AAV9PJ69_9PEZI|nr:RNA-binding component of cleavage and polyadenylation factor [Saxophila tyrrhenica]
MATATTATSLPDQILHPQSQSAPIFTFDNYLKQALPTLGAPSKLTRPICPDFTKGHCPRGPLCPDRHYVPKEERSGIGHLICKHYQRGLCKKGDACEFAHTFNLRDERECKEFSKYGLCPQGDDCTYLHIPPTSPLRRPACPQYARGFCPLGPYCALRHIKHAKMCPFYLAGFCPNGRSHPPEADKVVSCEFGAHAKWVRDEDMHPSKPEVKKAKDPEVLRREQEEREEEFYAEEERRRERHERGEGGMGRWAGRGRRARRGGFPSRRY